MVFTNIFSKFSFSRKLLNLNIFFKIFFSNLRSSGLTFNEDDYNYLIIKNVQIEIFSMK